MTLLKTAQDNTLRYEPSVVAGLGELFDGKPYAVVRRGAKVSIKVLRIAVVLLC